VSLPVPFVSATRRPSARGERIMPHDVNLAGEPRSHLRSGAGSVGRSSARLHGRPVAIEHVGGPADLFGAAPPGPDGTPVTDPAARDALAQRRSTPWSVAWHALEVLDYDLTAEFGSWAPPPPFAGNPHWLLTRLAAPWTRSEMLGYLDYCRKRVRDTLAGMTDEQAATPLPEAHRYRGQPHAWIITSAVGHTIEHAAQIRQFITAARMASEE
jgi:hypothetical protein